MGLREIRKSRNMSQSELACMCGINYRSLQDYEQGHKKLMSANGDILLRLTTVLGCTLSELLMADQVAGASLHSKNQVDTATIQNQRFYCEKYNVSGRWVVGNNSIVTMFYFNIAYQSICAYLKIVSKTAKRCDIRLPFFSFVP